MRARRRALISSGLVGLLACDAKSPQSPNDASPPGPEARGVAAPKVAIPATARAEGASEPTAAPATSATEPAREPPASGEPWPTRAQAGGSPCTASEPAILGENRQRRARDVGPLAQSGTPEYSNLQLVVVGGGVLAAWPRDGDSLNIQPLDLEARPRGPVTVLPLPGAPAFYAFVAHGGGAPYALVLSQRRCKGNHRRCLASQWVDADGRAFGKAFDLQLERDYLDEQFIAPEPRGVLTASSYDDTIRGYTQMFCERDPVPPNCPLVMPSPKLHLYSLDPSAGAAAATAEPTLLLDAKDVAVKDTVFPIVAGEERGMLHFFDDRKHDPHAVLRLAGKPPVPLSRIDRGHSPLRIAADPISKVVSVLREDSPGVLWRFGFDGSLREGPTQVDLTHATPAPFAEHVRGFVYGTTDETIVFSRRFDEPLVLARPKQVGSRFDSMRAVVWTGARYVVLYGELAKEGRWTVKARAITCPAGS